MAMERVKQFKDMTLKYDAVAGMTVTIYRYLTGTGLTQWGSPLSFPVSAGARTHTVPLDGLDAILFKLRVTSTGIVRLHGGVVRLRPLGVYFDGSNGEIWETQELGFGI